MSVRIRPDVHNSWTVATNSITNSETTYRLDRLFQEHESNQKVFEASVSGIVDKVGEGFNGAICCYGSSSSGKTFTLFGTKVENGTTYFAFQRLFFMLQQQKTDTTSFSVKCSFYDVCNERIRDLLTGKGNLNLVEDGLLTSISGLRKVICSDASDIETIISQAESFRLLGRNNNNARLHTILQLGVEKYSSTGELETVSTFSVIDLGSEPNDKSLVDLARVISDARLGTNSSCLVGDSKLSRVLLSSLSGESFLSVICTLDLRDSNRSTVLQTLSFAGKLNSSPAEGSVIVQLREENRILKERLAVMLESNYEESKSTGRSNILEELDSLISCTDEEFSVDEIPASDQIKNELEEIRMLYESRTVSFQMQLELESEKRKRAEFEIQLVCKKSEEHLEELRVELENSKFERIMLQRSLIQRQSYLENIGVDRATLQKQLSDLQLQVENNEEKTLIHRKSPSMTKALKLLGVELSPQGVKPRRLNPFNRGYNENTDTLNTLSNRNESKAERRRSSLTASFKFWDRSHKEKPPTQACEPFV